MHFIEITKNIVYNKKKLLIMTKYQLFIKFKINYVLHEFCFPNVNFKVHHQKNEFNKKNFKPILKIIYS